MNLKNILNKICFALSDTVLIYTVLLITSSMYYYRSSLAPVFAIVSLIAVRLIFWVFDFIARHKYIGVLIYIAIFSTGVFTMGKLIDIGEDDYPISFLLWFITTQDALEFNAWFTWAIYVFALGFFSSVVYYFCKVQYRLSMGFLIFMIPFVIYGKESEKMPSVFTVILSLMLIVNIIRFSNERNGKAIVEGKRSVYGSVAVFAMGVGLISSFIPKPNINADRTYLESLINMDAFTDMLISKLNVFNTEADSGKFNSLTTNDKIVFYALADEPLRLKTQAFRDYSFESDGWKNKNIKWQDSNYGVVSPSSLLNIIVLCSELDTDFAKKYNIDSTSFNSEFTDDIKQVTVYPSNYSFQMLPIPTLLDYVDSGDEECQTDLYTKAVRSTDGNFNSVNYTADYFSDSFLYDSDVKKIISGLSFSSDEGGVQLYEDMCDILSDYGYKSELNTALAVKNYAEDAQTLLDYGNSEKIRQLALEITEGCSSDYEKALAIESYFFENDFIYDLTYRKDSDENVETFLFETKRGVCYEYATAMVLLARSCGIPARYAEGYNMNEVFEAEKNTQMTPDYSIRIKDAHGFPELWIQGIGWVSFEPTVADEIIDYKQTDISKGLYISGVVLASLILLVFIFIKLYPALYNRFFILKIKKSEPEKAVSLIFVRVRSLYGFGNDVTASELYEFLYNSHKTDISMVKNLFEKSAYGQIPLTENDKKEVIELYRNIYENFIEYEKSMKNTEVEKWKNR